jgi:hypothetical protein
MTMTRQESVGHYLHWQDKGQTMGQSHFDGAPALEWLVKNSQRRRARTTDSDMAGFV